MFRAGNTHRLNRFTAAVQHPDPLSRAFSQAAALGKESPNPISPFSSRLNAAKPEQKKGANHFTSAIRAAVGLPLGYDHTVRAGLQFLSLGCIVGELPALGLFWGLTRSTLYHKVKI